MEVQKRYILPLDDASVRDEVERIAARERISVLEASILYNRGLRAHLEIEETMRISLDNMIDPRLMKDAMNAAKHILAAIDAGEKICLYSDYDCDGFGAGVVGYEMMSKGLGADMFIFTNTRDMGYGMNKEDIDKLLAKHPDTKMIVTADNGVVAFEGVEYAKSLGLKVVITDHHQPDVSGKLPDALAVVNPHRFDESYPYRQLCGTGVLWKVLSICYNLKGIPAKQANDLLDIVAVATVADVVPITG